MAGKFASPKKRAANQGNLANLANLTNLTGASRGEKQHAKLGALK
jgi:hypothetical protein